MNKNPDFFSVVFCITVICLTIPATREPLIKFIKPLFESGASDDYKRKLLEEYNNKVNSNNDLESRNLTDPNEGQLHYSRLGNNPTIYNEYLYKKTSNGFQLDSINAINAFTNRDISFEDYDKIYNKNNDLSQKLLNRLSYESRNYHRVPNFYASMQTTQGYAESIAANQNFYLDEYGEVVNEKPNLSIHRYKLIIYNEDWAYQRH